MPGFEILDARTARRQRETYPIVHRTREVLVLRTLTDHYAVYTVTGERWLTGARRLVVDATLVARFPVKVRDRSLPRPEIPSEPLGSWGSMAEQHLTLDMEARYRAVVDRERSEAAK